MSILLQIILATVVSTVISIGLAGLISFRFLNRHMSKMICVAAGLLLAVAFTHLLPEAFEHHEEAGSIGWTLLVSVLVLFGIEQFFSQHHETDDISHLLETRPNGKGGEAILFGDAFHNFTDGILIASSFMVSPSLGWVTALAIMAHEIPQEVGDFMVLLHSGYEKGKALVYNFLSGLSAVAGGIAGYFLLDRVNWIIPYAFAVAAASFIYIALSDLMPELAKKGRSAFWIQIAFILIGVAIAVLATGTLHSHH
ncbi:MAG: ZIP family metal transporter [Klebsiella quasipneumoniae]|nr:ZIP family metal transporter [Klebsiella quasipneumoniae]